MLQTPSTFAIDEGEAALVVFERVLIWVQDHKATHCDQVESWQERVAKQEA